MRIETASRILWDIANADLSEHEHEDCDGYDPDDDDYECDWTRRVYEAMNIMRDLIPFEFGRD